MEQFLYTDRRTDGQTDTTKHYSPQTIRNGWGLKSSDLLQLSAFIDAKVTPSVGSNVIKGVKLIHPDETLYMYAVMCETSTCTDNW